MRNEFIRSSAARKFAKRNVAMLPRRKGRCIKSSIKTFVRNGTEKYEYFCVRPSLVVRREKKIKQKNIFFFRDFRIEVAAKSYSEMIRKVSWCIVSCFLWNSIENLRTETFNCEFNILKVENYVCIIDPIQMTIIRRVRTRVKKHHETPTMII